MYSRRSYQVIFDFDGTITTKDTIEPLVQSALAFQHPSLTPVELGQTSLAEAWSNCKSQYLAELSAHYEKENSEPSDDVPVTGPRAIEREKRSLDALWDVEMASVQRVGESGIFKGIKFSSFREMGRSAALAGRQGANNRAVRIREDFPEFLRWIRGTFRADWGVVSVNWNKHWVQGVMDVVGDNFNVNTHGYVTANDVDSRTGMIIGYPRNSLSAIRYFLLTTADKLRAQKNMLEFCFDLGFSSPPALTVYIGDSLTDLSPLLHADIGIIMNSAPSTPGALDSLIDRCGYRVLPVSEYKKLYSKEENEKVAILLSINNYTEIIDSGMLQDENWDPTAAKEAWKKSESEN